MNYFRRSLWSVLLGMSLFLFGSCGDEEDRDAGPSYDPVDYSLIVKGLPFADTSSAYEEITDVAVFQFCDGRLYKQQKLTPDQDGKTDVAAVADARLYCVANVTLRAQENVTTETDFSQSVIESGAGDRSAPYFLSTVTDLKSADIVGREVIVTMKHGVARIDLNTLSDRKILIDELTVENAPAATRIFVEKDPVSGKTVSYKKPYEPAFSGKDEAVFYLFESADPVTVTVHGSYDGIPVRIQVSIPEVERNKIYELEILNAGATFKGVFDVKDWEDGETVTGKPDTDRRITISPSQSSLPQGITADFEKNVVNVPASGITGLRLAFVADTRIDITDVEGLAEGVSVGRMTVTDAPEGIVSAFDVSIPAQTNGRLGYSVFVHLKNALFADSYDFVEIKVAPSDHQIETVEMGGNIWMAFNARTPDLDDQIYTLDGLSVEEMYRYNWINTVGGLFQFGRQYMYTPWVGYNPSNNLGGQEQDIPWQSASHTPCPEGYRLPTRTELESIFPKGETIPGSYVVGNGERITATLHTAEGKLITPTGVSGSQRYVKFTAEDTGRYLIIPLAGGKGDKSTSNNPAFGKRAVLWTNSNAGCPGGYALAYWMKFENNESTAITEERLQMEAFASVRCVKIK